MTIEKTSKYKILLSKDALADIRETKKYILTTFKYREYAENFSRKIKKAIFCLFSFKKMWICVLVIIFYVFRLIAIFPVCFAEPLEVHNFPCAQEADGVDDVWIFDDAQDVIVGASGFLLCCHIFYDICDGVGFYLKFAGVLRHAACGLRPNAQCMVDVIFAEAGFLDLFRR